MEKIQEQERRTKTIQEKSRPQSQTQKETSRNATMIGGLSLVTQWRRSMNLFMHPLYMFVQLSLSSVETNHLSQMPYLAYSSHCEDLNGTKDTKLKEAHKDYEGLLESYKGTDEQQHGSPTLDEWYYQFAQDDKEAIDDQKQRNKSQVVSKYLKETEDEGSTLKPGQWTVVRVNQLWIWTISNGKLQHQLTGEANRKLKDWIITATSSPFDNSPDTLVDEILNLLSKQAEYGGSRSQPVTASDLVPVIIEHCVDSYERRPNECKRISIGQTFSHYINRIVRRHIHTLSR